MRTLLTLLLVSTTALVFVGCKKSDSLGSSISGTVTYKGQPVTGGTMLFHASNNVFPASLKGDGTYTIANLAPGDYVVTVDTRALKNKGDPESMMKSMTQKMGKGDGAVEKLPDSVAKSLAKMKEMKQDNSVQFVQIPEKYADPKTSGLKVSVQAGSNTKEIPLTD
jgi:hypothetical protein